MRSLMIFVSSSSSKSIIDCATQACTREEFATLWQTQTQLASLSFASYMPLHVGRLSDQSTLEYAHYNTAVYHDVGRRWLSARRFVDRHQTSSSHDLAGFSFKDKGGRSAGHLKSYVKKSWVLQHNAAGYFTSKKSTYHRVRRYWLYVRRRRQRYLCSSY